MADPLSITASIVALLQLSDSVVRYINEVKEAGQERLKISAEISGTSVLVRMLGERIEEEESNPAWFPTIKSLGLPNGPFEQFKQALQCIESKMAPSKGLAKVGKALAWPFKKDEIGKLLNTLERLKSLFHLALENDHV
jgi:hypothetical protein